MCMCVFRMSVFLLTCTLLCSLFGGTLCNCTLKNYTLWIEKSDCAQCVAVNTTICSGYCYTQDTNLKGRPGRIYLIQRGCMPGSLAYRAVRVPGCPQHVNPVLYYPESRRCRCRRCDRRTHHCVRTGRAAFNRCGNTGAEGKRPPGET